MSSISLKNIKTSGTIYTTTTNDTILATAGDTISISDCVFDGKQYNSIFCNYSTGSTVVPSTVTIENCEFPGEIKNNGVSICAIKENGTITLKNCHFANVSNAFRYMNMNNVSGVTINIEDCRCDKWETTQASYSGFFLFEDATSADGASALEANRFAPAKVVVNVKNLIGPDGKKVAPSNLSTVMGVKNTSQIGYVCIDKDNYSVLDYSTTRYPEFHFE